MLFRSSGATANLGSFGDDVWPVVGLAIAGPNAADGAFLANAMEAARMTAPAAMDPSDVPAGLAENN